MINEDLIKKLLIIVKKRCYISSNLFDDEISSLISSCILDCIETGISKEVFAEEKENEFNSLVLNCITNYVKAHRGNDRSDTDKYLKMYVSIRDKMSLLNDYVKLGEKNE